MVWKSTFKSYLKKLDSIHKNALKIIKHTEDYLSLKLLFKLSCLVFAFRFLSGLLPPPFRNLFLFGIWTASSNYKTIYTDPYSTYANSEVGIFRLTSSVLRLTIPHRLNWKVGAPLGLSKWELKIILFWISLVWIKILNIKVILTIIEFLLCGGWSGLLTMDEEAVTCKDGFVGGGHGCIEEWRESHSVYLFLRL